eukprot:gene11931-13838_t
MGFWLDKIPGCVLSITGYVELSASSAPGGGNGLIPRHLAEHLLRTKVLHWIVTERETIARSNFLSGNQKATFNSFASLDLVEMRAVAYAMPLVFHNDNSGELFKWRVDFFDVLMARVSRQKGELKPGAYCPVLNARKLTEQLPLLPAEEHRAAMYSYPPCEEIERKHTDFQLRDAEGVRLQDNLNAALEEEALAMKQKEIAVHEAKHPEEYEPPLAQLVSNRDMAIDDLKVKTKTRMAAEKALAKFEVASTNLPVSKETFLKERSYLLNLMEREGIPWGQPGCSLVPVICSIDPHAEILPPVQVPMAKFSTEDSVQARQEEIARILGGSAKAAVDHTDTEPTGSLPTKDPFATPLRPTRTSVASIAATLADTVQRTFTNRKAPLTGTTFRAPAPSIDEKSNTDICSTSKALFQDEKDEKLPAKKPSRSKFQQMRDEAAARAAAAAASAGPPDSIRSPYHRERSLKHSPMRASPLQKVSKPSFLQSKQSTEGSGDVDSAEEIAPSTIAARSNLLAGLLANGNRGRLFGAAAVAAAGGGVSSAEPAPTPLLDEIRATKERARAAAAGSAAAGGDNVGANNNGSAAVPQSGVKADALSAFAENKKALAAALFANANRGPSFRAAPAASSASAGGGGGEGEQCGDSKDESAPMSGEKAEAPAAQAEPALVPIVAPAPAFGPAPMPRNPLMAAIVEEARKRNAAAGGGSADSMPMSGELAEVPLAEPIASVAAAVESVPALSVSVPASQPTVEHQPAAQPAVSLFRAPAGGPAGAAGLSLMEMIRARRKD